VFFHNLKQVKQKPVTENATSKKPENNSSSDEKIGIESFFIFYLICYITSLLNTDINCAID